MAIATPFPSCLQQVKPRQESFETVCYQARAAVVIQVQMMAARQLRHLDSQPRKHRVDIRLRQQHPLLRHHQLSRALQAARKCQGVSMGQAQRRWQVKRLSVRQV